MVFNYWTVVLKLLELGIPWEQIHSFESVELALVLGVHLAMEQRKSEQEDQMQRYQQRPGFSATHFSHVRGR